MVGVGTPALVSSSYLQHTVLAQSPTDPYSRGHSSMNGPSSRISFPVSAEAPVYLNLAFKPSKSHFPN